MADFIQAAHSAAIRAADSGESLAEVAQANALIQIAMELNEIKGILLKRQDLGK